MQILTAQNRAKSIVIGEIISKGVAFNPKNWNMEFKINPAALPLAVQNFLNLMRDLKVDFVLVGGVAIQAYIETRNTQDIDFIVKRADAGRLFDYLEILNSDDTFANCLTSEGLRVDFLFAENPIFNYVRQGFTQNIEYGEGILPTATPEGLMLMKLFAWSNLQMQNLIFNDKQVKMKLILYESDIKLLAVFYEIDLDKLLRLLKRQISETAFQMTKEFVETL